MFGKKKQQYDVFISYRRSTGWMLARLVYESLVARGLSVFLDVDELKTGEFDKKLYDCIENTPNFVFILSEGCLDRCNEENDWVRQEITHALKSNKNIIPVFGTEVKLPDKLPNELERFPYLNRLEIDQGHFQSSISELVNLLKDTSLTKKNKTDRIASDYYKNYKSQTETKRLKVQHEVNKKIDKAAYKKIISKYDELQVLDLGSGKGTRLMDRLGNNPKTKLVVGIEYNHDSVLEATKNFGNDHVKFYEQSVEDDDFEQKLEQIVKENNAKFNIIHIGMLLLHIKDPAKMLRIVKKFLQPGGSIIIIDIDDGLNIAYPDPNNLFKHLDSISVKLHEAKLCGDRSSGRKIYKYLQRSDFSNITVERLGMTIMDLSSDERLNLFNACFSWIKERTARLHEQYPNDPNVTKEHNWLETNFETMEDMFLSKDFFFSYGWVIYTATK